MATTKQIKWLAVLAVILLVGIVLIMRGRTSVKKSDGFWADAWNENMNRKYNEMTPDSGAIVFAGTSLTYNFPLDSMLPGYRIKNRGIPWNQSRHLLNRLKSILNRAPGQLYIEIGINDLIQGVAEDSLFANCQSIITQTQTAGVRLHFQSLLPTRGKYKYLLPCIQSFNRRLKEYCFLNKIDYVDLFSGLSLQGELDPLISTDGLHLNLEGYKRWKKLLKL